jgi:hypothetical protein
LPQTLDQINALRRLQGQEPLTEMPVEEGTKQRSEIADESNAEEPSKIPVSTAPAEIPQINDDTVLKYLQQKGIQVNALDELNKPTTEADLAKQTEDRENAKLTYGLNKGLFNRKTHEQFILDKSNKQQLVFAQYYQDSKKEDPELSDEDIQVEFAAKYGLDSEPNTRKHKRGLQEIDILGDIILKNKYQNIFKLDSEYDVYERQTNSQKEFERKIIQEAPNYKKVVDEIFVDFKKITTKFSDDETYEIDVLDDSITSLKEKFLDKNFVAQKISEGYTKEELKEIVFTALLRQNWSVFAKEMINQALLKKQKGVKGITPLGIQKNEVDTNHLSEQQNAVLQRYFPNHQAQIAN